MPKLYAQRLRHSITALYDHPYGQSLHAPFIPAFTQTTERRYQRTTHRDGAHLCDTLTSSHIEQHWSKHMLRLSLSLTPKGIEHLITQVVSYQ